jgi:membrane-associated phospholipid phosphatase
VVIVLVLAAAVAAVAYGVYEAHAQLERDAAALVTVSGPLPKDRLALGLGLVELAASDETRWVALARQELPGWIDSFKPLGAGRTANIVGASLLANGLVRRERRSMIGGLTLLEGNLILGVVVDVSKQAFGRVRPNHPGPGRWFAGGDSFPSSHAAHAFLIASVLGATLEEPESQWIIFAMASGVALQRLHEGVHYPTDVLAGGALGWWIGHRLSVSHGLVGRPVDLAVPSLPTAGGAGPGAAPTF